MDIQVTGLNGKADKLSVSDEVFAAEFKEPLIHQVVVAYMAEPRVSPIKKTRSDVSGGGKKPWRQKGTGHARAGTIRSPLWRGGGVTFGGQRANHQQKVNRKMYRGAMVSILSELVRQERLVVVDELKPAEAKTKAAVALLQKFDVADSKVLLVTAELNSDILLATRNLHNVFYCQVQHIDPVNLVQADKVIIEQAALKSLEEKLA